MMIQGKDLTTQWVDLETQWLPFSFSIATFIALNKIYTFTAKDKDYTTEDETFTFTAKNKIYNLIIK